ncbi:hypothetical protein MKW98_009064 [Papaver atlanticum]|uniref:Inhibitor I9 domain-containing protein n=1 Tax=Papaver atlanticum TaxID=357466 RepID=A0AAD4RX51_9MAGN|nr:hypothetical protein MKW98_009064 [Papaver atlanticum]
MKSGGIVLVFWGLLVFGKAQEVYIVTMEGEPVVSYNGGVEGFEATAAAEDADERIDTASELVTCYSHHLVKNGTYKKLYSYKHLINGFSVHTTPEQAESLRQAPGVKSVERDWKVGVWPTGGGCDRAGEDIVIGLLIQEYIHIILALQPTIPRHMDLFQNIEETAVASGTFNPSVNHAYPLDGGGHGSHTAAIAAGNNGIPLQMHGFEFGRASGMAPRARIVVYKALY